MIGKNMLQIANLGQIYPQDCRNFLEELKDILQAMGRQQDQSTRMPA